MNFIILTAMIISAVSGIFSLVRQFQMLQQNSYFVSRYSIWLKESFTVELSVLAIIFCASSFLYTAKVYVFQAILLAIVLIYRVFSAIIVQKKSIKKLVFTARVKRLFATAIIILGLLIAVYCITPNSLLGEICTILTLMISIVSPLLCLLVRFVTTPVDKAVTNWYINDAKRIIKEQKDLKVIGITGSYGKTTTKFVLKRILSEKYNVVATPQSFNTPMGVVRTIREQLQPQTQLFVCEMGAKNIGDIKEICDIVHPDFGIITSVGAQHLETFKTIDNVYKTKFELADAVSEKGGSTFVNGDSLDIASRISKDDYIVYGTDETMDFYAKNVVYGANGSTFDLVLKDETITVTTKLLGMHSVIDIVAASSVAYTLGVKAEDIKFAISALKPTEHRLELKRYGESLLIDDAYNANPEGCLEAVRVLGSFDGMKKAIITPGLIELGDKEYECNYALGLEAAKFCDIIILVGKNRSKPMREAVETTDFNKDNLFIAASFKEAMSIYQKYSDNNSVVLLENDLPDNYLN